MIPLHEALRIVEGKLKTANYIIETTKSKGMATIYENQTDWLIQCIYALNKQIGVKPYKGTCPTCGTDGHDEYGRKKYCSNCGQKLDWRDTP